MTALASIAMSQTKDDLLKHLNLPSETYALMAKETDAVYSWLITDHTHLKENGKRKAPYDWSDFQEKSKDIAIEAIASRGDQYTAYYWDLGTQENGEPNWVAKWFLYHKFRYRDGRNRSQKNGEKHHSKSGKSSNHRHASKHKQAEYDYNNEGSGSNSQGYSTHEADSATGYYEAAQYNYATVDTGESSGTQTSTYYDPVRDI